MVRVFFLDRWMDVDLMFENSLYLCEKGSTVDVSILNKI